MLGRNLELQSGHLKHIISCDPHNHLRTTCDWCPHFTELERLSDLPKIIRSGRGETRFQFTWALHQIRRPAKAQKVIHGAVVWAQIQCVPQKSSPLKEGLSECLLRCSRQRGLSVTFQMEVAFFPTLLLPCSHFGKFIIRLMKFFLGFYFWIFSMSMSSRAQNKWLFLSLDFSTHFWKSF